MKSWNGAVNGVVRRCERSTCSSPSTSRRVRSPASSEGEVMVPHPGAQSPAWTARAELADLHGRAGVAAEHDAVRAGLRDRGAVGPAMDAGVQDGAPAAPRARLDADALAVAGGDDRAGDRA